MQSKSLFGIEVIAGTKFESKLRIFRAKNYKFTFALLDTKQLVEIGDTISTSHKLSQINFLGINSRITHFFLWKQQSGLFIPSIYRRVYNWVPRSTRSILYQIFFGIQYLINYFQFFLLTILRMNLTSRTKMQELNSRDFLFEILKQAEEEGRRVLYLDFEKEAGEVVAELVVRLFPELDFVSYLHSPHSLTVEGLSGDFFIDYPEYYEASEYLKKQKSDIVLLATRNTMKNELEFLTRLKKNTDIQFTSLVMTDVREFTETKKELQASQKLSLFSLLTNEQFIQDLDVHEAWDYQLQFFITTPNKQHILRSDRSQFTVRVQNLNQLERQVLLALEDITTTPSEMSVNGSVKRLKGRRILPIIEDMRRHNYSSSRTITLNFELEYKGLVSNLTPEAKVFE